MRRWTVKNGILIWQLTAFLAASCQTWTAELSQSPPTLHTSQRESGIPASQLVDVDGIGIPTLPVSNPWQWQLTDLPLDKTIDAQMFDLDLFENDAGVVAELQVGEIKVVCYLNAGAWEDWRPDAGDFPEQVLGKKYRGWPGERWLDIRQIDQLAPIIRARLDLCQEKGFNGVEPDNIDGFQNNTGFPLTYQDQLNYNIWLASEAHQRGLSIGLKNDPDQAGDLVDIFDWALVEDCFAENWCGKVGVFIDRKKPVFAAEYTDHWSESDFLDQVCPQAHAGGFNIILKNRELDAWRRICP